MKIFFFGLHTNLVAKSVLRYENVEFFVNLGQNFYETAAAFQMCQVKLQKRSPLQYFAVYVLQTTIYQKLSTFLHFTLFLSYFNSFEVICSQTLKVSKSYQNNQVTSIKKVHIKTLENSALFRSS